MPEEPEDKITLEVLAITDVPQPDTYALILIEKGGEYRKLPILIGLPEAQSVAVRLQGLRSPRPLTHDIFMTLALSFQIEMVEAIVYKCVDGIYYSQIVCKRNDKVIYIDSRTSDAVALAIRFNAPIYTYNSVFTATWEKLNDTAQSTKPLPVENGVNLSLTDVDSLKKMNDDVLNELMQNAISQENYEIASIIRDIIKSRK